jgi:hypothetical protein
MLVPRLKKSALLTYCMLRPFLGKKVHAPVYMESLCRGNLHDFVPKLEALDVQRWRPGRKYWAMGPYAERKCWA